MTSLIAWLDASSEEQRRMREIIRLFSDRESRDELGLGQIRDALSDGLFPGTSTLHTRARYALFVPWTYMIAARHHSPEAEADRLQRKLIGALRDSDDHSGLLGLQAGVGLKTLPSSIYWSMLRRFEILVGPDMAPSDALAFDGTPLPADLLDGPSDASARAWSPTIPPPPAGFPAAVHGGFALTADEAGWLRDRILDAVPGSLLAHLMVHAPDDDSDAPWTDSAALSASGDAKDLLDHARRFSAVIHGAQLLYNTMLAEQYESAGFDRLPPKADAYRDRFARWAQTVDGAAGLADWDVGALLARVGAIRGRPLHPRTTQFTREWTETVRSARDGLSVDDPSARAIIHRRERQTKGAQARLHNLRRLQTWGGASAARALTFRWPNVHRLAHDIHDGLSRDQETHHA